MDMMALRRTLMDKSYMPPFAECIATGNPAFFAANTTRNMKISVQSAQENTPATIWVSGTNIWDEQWELAVIESDGSISPSYSRMTSKNFIPVVAGKTYRMVWPRGHGLGRGAFYDASHALVQYKGDFPDNNYDNGTTASGTFTVPNGACFVKFSLPGSIGTTYANNVSVNYPDIDQDYHAYTGAEYSVTLPTRDPLSVNGNNVVTCSVSGDMQVKFYCDNPSEDKLVVMTYNVQAFTLLNADKDMQNDIIEEYEPSIIGIQEMGQNYQPTSVLEFITTDYWCLMSGEQPQKTGIASKYGLSNVQYHAFTDNTSDTKGYQTAEFKFKGKTVFFVNAHTISSPSAVLNAAQCEELLDLVSTKDTFILVGDLNTDIMSTSPAQYTNCIKPFIDAGYKLANCQSSFIGTWTGGKTEQDQWYATDNIICSADFTMSNVRRDTIKIAEAGVQDKTIDHVALICELTL